MPYGDRTGPAGDGAGTGRGMGFCNGYRMPGCMSNYPHHFMHHRHGFVGGGGGGRRSFGHRARYFAHNTGFHRAFRNESQWIDENNAGWNNLSEREVLKREQEMLSAHLEEIQKRLEMLDSQE